MRRSATALLVVALTAFSVGRADSLWERRDPRYAFLFQDTRARNIGDTLIITISETTVANDQDQRNLSRTSSGSGQVTVFDTLRAPGSTGTAAATGGAGSMQIQAPTQNTAYSFAGSAANTTNHVFTDQMGVVVVDQLPNGNLVVEGFRSRVVGGEERVLRITGIVRQADIGAGNTIPSGSVANFRISYIGRGPATANNRQGILSRLNSIIRLF